jgi:hypothetical protein
MEINTGTQTEWNGGTLTNIRIHQIRDELKLCALTNNLTEWLTLLVQMNHEVYGFETPTQQKEIREELKELAEKINSHQQTKNKTRHLRGTQTGIPAELIDSLHDMQYKLDEIFHKSGLQTALKDDAGDSF